MFVIGIIVCWFILALINLFCLRLYECISSFGKNNPIVTLTYGVMAIALLITLLPRLTILPFEVLFRKKGK